MTNLWPAFRCPQHQKTGQNTQQVMFLRQFSTCLVNLLHVRAWHFWCGTNCIIYSCHVSSQCLGHCFPTILNLGRSTYSRGDSSDRKVSLVQIPVREGFSLIEKSNCSQWIPDRIWTTMDMGYTLMLWVVVYMLRHVTHYYLISFVKGLFPRVSEAQCGYTSLHEYVITIIDLNDEGIGVRQSLL